MSKPDTRFKITTNRLLRLVAERYEVGDALPVEESLASLCEVSRTTVRAALTHLEDIQVLKRQRRVKIVNRRPSARDTLTVPEFESHSELIEKTFMERVLRGNLVPGQHFTETELAREAGVANASVREFLIGFSRYRLIEKRPRGGWRLCAFDARFAEELADMRDMLELQAIEKLDHVVGNDPVWGAISQMRAKHDRLKPVMQHQYNEFPALDRQFHSLIIERLGNRFALGFYDVISFVFHYHYQWDRQDEMERNLNALNEHLAVLEALDERQVPRAAAHLRTHLATARRTLRAAIGAKG
jgi:DNA-binding GntR family transcriptional regulator